VPVNFNARGNELVYLLTQSEPRAAFVDPSLFETVQEVAARLGDTTLGALRDGYTGENNVLSWALDVHGPVHEEQGVGDEDLVQLLYTSGTTSQAKGAMLTHRALVHEYISAIVAFELSERDVPLHALPLYHSAQMHCFLMPALAVGATNHLLEAPDLDEIFARVPRDGIDSLFFPPTVWVGLANHPRLAEAELDGLRKAFYGASIMPVPVLHKLQARLPNAGFFNCFGQSEIGPLATVLRPEEHAARPDSVGRAVLFVETRVVDPDFNDVAAGEVGEVVYRSPQLCAGYWGKPQETAEAFRGGWFHSGDLCRIDAEGYLYVVDRLAAHKVPKSVHFVAELPKNASGKLLKRELRAQLSAPTAPSPSLS
jgi:fatty-acyl-CoA synthase